MKTKASKTFNSRLAAYSATATAALLAAPAVADAQGIQTITSFSYNGGVNFVPTPPSAAGANGIDHLSFIGGVFNGSISNANKASYGAAGIKGSIEATSHGNASLLAFDDAISGKHFHNPYNVLAFRSAGTSVSGAFLPAANGAVTGYVGFKAVENANTYYGWLRVKVTAGGNGYPNGVSLVDKSGDGIYGAFGLKGTDITAGAVPEPSIAAIGGLSLLALGAMGVREMRRRRKA